MTNFPAMIECRAKEEHEREGGRVGPEARDGRAGGRTDTKWKRRETLWHSLDSDLSAGEEIVNERYHDMANGRNDQEQASST